MAGIERAKGMLEHAFFRVKDAFFRRFEMEKKNGFPVLNLDLIMMFTCACTLGACYVVLEEEDDSDEEESDNDLDEYCEGSSPDECIESEEEKLEEREEQRQLFDSQNAGEADVVMLSDSDSLCSTLTSPQMRGHRGIERAKLMLERVICTMSERCIPPLERVQREMGTAERNHLRVPIACFIILFTCYQALELTCYQGLDEEDDSDEEQSDLNTDEEMATEEEYTRSEEDELADQQEQKQLAAGSRPKRRRDEET